MLGGMGFGGGEKYVLYIVEGLSGADYSFHLATYQESLFTREARRRGHNVTVIDMTSRFNPLSLYKLTQFFKRERFDLVHTNGARMNFYGRLAARLAGVPNVCSTVHNSLYDYPIGALKRSIYVRVDAWTARYADRIITVAEALAKDLRDKYGIPREKVLTIHNGINMDEMRPTRSREAIRDELGVPSGSPCLTAIGRMTQQKGFTYFLKALPSITRRFPSVRCFFVGDGPLRDELEREASTLDLHNNCQFTGMRTDIVDILKATDIFVLPSLSEGFPMVLLEAMGMGRPVVATAVSGNPELIENGRSGLLVPPKDPKAISKAVYRLLENPLEAEEGGKAAQVEVSTKFTVEIMVKKTEEVYRTISGLRPIP
jgi:glycosyltransferase involved in cell wall biosynthesis